MYKTFNNSQDRTVMVLQAERYVDNTQNQSNGFPIKVSRGEFWLIINIKEEWIP